MTFSFVPAGSVREGHGLFIALVGPSNSGKTFSSLRLARGIAGPKGKIAVLDTEGGRTLHLKKDFDFDVMMMAPPFRPDRFAEAAIDAEAAKYDVLLIDSFSQEWAGLGGVLEWHDAEAERMSGGDERKLKRVNMAAWIKPKREHKLMVNSFLQRRIPIIFAIRGEDSIKPDDGGGTPQKIFKMQMDGRFAFEVTVSFRLKQNTQGIIDLSDPTACKMEGIHKKIFRHGEQLGERHGELLAAWARGENIEASAPEPRNGAPTGAGADESSTGTFSLSEDRQREILETADLKSDEGRDAFLTWVKNDCNADEQNYLRSLWDRFKMKW